MIDCHTSDSVEITVDESAVAAEEEEEEVIVEEEQQPPEDGGELLVCIRGGGPPPREAELTLEEIEASLELGLAERITIGPCPPGE